MAFIAEIRGPDNMPKAHSLEVMITSMRHQGINTSGSRILDWHTILEISREKLGTSRKKQQT